MLVSPDMDCITPRRDARTVTAVHGQRTEVMADERQIRCAATQRNDTGNVTYKVVASLKTVWTGAARRQTLSARLQRSQSPTSRRPRLRPHRRHPTRRHRPTPHTPPAAPRAAKPERGGVDRSLPRPRPGPYLYSARKPHSIHRCGLGIVTPSASTRPPRSRDEQQPLDTRAAVPVRRDDAGRR